MITWYRWEDEVSGRWKAESRDRAWPAFRVEEEEGRWSITVYTAEGILAAHEWNRQGVRQRIKTGEWVVLPTREARRIALLGRAV